MSAADEYEHHWRQLLRRTGDEERPLVRASTTAMASPKMRWRREKFPIDLHKCLSVKMAARASSMHCGSEAAHILDIARLQQPPQMSLGTSGKSGWCLVSPGRRSQS